MRLRFSRRGLGCPVRPVRPGNPLLPGLLLLDGGLLQGGQDLIALVYPGRVVVGESDGWNPR